MRFQIILYSLLLMVLGPAGVMANESLSIIKSISLNGRFMNVDELGNVYVVRTDNTLIRYNENGDSSAFYRSMSNGNISCIDANNPLRLIVFYADYGKVEVLDRMLALKNEINLRESGIVKAPTVASSADGNLWVYDQFNARLRKIDDQMKEVGQSNDLRQQLQSVPRAVFMTERDRKLYLCDTTEGILVFDQYGSYINTLSIFGVQYLQVFGSQLIYRQGNKLTSFDLKSVRSQEITLPEDGKELLQAAIVRNTLYVLYRDRLVLYRLIG